MKDTIEIIAHRGASDTAPENTLAAMRLAWEEGADAVEADFRLTADGRLVAIHDEGLRRTAGSDQLVAKLTLEDLSKLDVGRWKGPKWEGERIATLGEMLEAMPEGKRFYIEIKSGPESTDDLARVVQSSKRFMRQVVTISLSGAVVAAAKRALPEVPTYLVADFAQDRQSGAWRPTAGELIRRARQSNADGLDLMADGPIDSRLVEQVREAGLELCVWTVDSAELARRLIDCGVRRITTNRPGWLRRQLAL